MFPTKSKAKAKPKTPARPPLTEKDATVGSRLIAPSARSAGTSIYKEVELPTVTVDSLMLAKGIIPDKENQTFNDSNNNKRPRGSADEGERERSKGKKKAPALYDPMEGNAEIVDGRIILATSTSDEDGGPSDINGADEDEDLSDWDNDSTLSEFKYTCNQIRSKIRAFINSGQMKVGQFQRTLKVSPNSYNNFMKPATKKIKGVMNGEFSDTYTQAHKLFVQLDRQGIKIPSKKASTSTSTAKNSREAGTTTTTESSTGKTTTKNTKDILEEYNVDEITLEYETGLNVSVFDTCDDVRNKINAHLRRPGITMASFCRSIAEEYRKGLGQEEAVPIQHKQLRDFLEKKGATSGCTSKVFYGAYIYFEKLRIKQKKPKSKKRLEMERIHGPNGMSIERDSAHQHYTVMVGTYPHQDSYGKMTFW